jgi:hypothetical protein
MNAKARVAQRRHARFHALAYAAGSMPHGSIGSPPVSGEQECMRIDPEPTRPGLDTCQHWTPAWALIKAQVCSVLEPWDSTVGGLDPIRRGLDPILGVRSVHVGFLDQSWRSGLYIQGSGTFPWVGTFPWGSRLNVDASEYIIVWTRGGPEPAHVVGLGAVVGPK